LSHYSSDNVINLDADKDNVEYHTQVNVGNVGADSTVSAVDSDNKDRVKSCGDESSSSNNNGNCIQKPLLLEQPVRRQDTIGLDNCNSSTEPHDLFKQPKDDMDTDNVSAKVRSTCHENSYYLFMHEN
jgi:DNA repair and recombination protein RAD54 and RAD54-like protein